MIKAILVYVVLIGLAASRLYLATIFAVVTDHLRQVAIILEGEGV